MASKSLFRGLSTNAREEQNTRYSNFEEDMRAAGRNLSPPKLNAQKKRIWDVRPGVRNDNNDMNDFFVKNDISWIKVSKPWDNPFAERGIRTIKHEYLNQVWIGNLSEFEKLSEIIKLHYNECCPHQSFDNKTPAEVRIAATGNNQEYSPPRELEKWDAFYRSILGRTKLAIC